MAKESFSVIHILVLFYLPLYVLIVSKRECHLVFLKNFGKDSLSSEGLILDSLTV